MHLARLSSIAVVRAAAEERLADDWIRFLTARSSELRKGGKLLSLIIIRIAERAGSGWLVSNLWDSVIEMGRDGLLSEQEQLRITIPIGQRSMTEIKAPFADKGRFAGLELEHAEIVQIPARLSAARRGIETDGGNGCRGSTGLGTRST